MKRILSFLTASLAIVTMMLCCSHCSKDDSGSGNSGKPYIRLNFSEKMVSNSAGSLEVFVSSNTEWISEPRSKWLSVDRSGGKGDLAVRISFEENGTEKRTGIVRFTADGVNPVEIIITQSALTFTNPITIGGNIATMPDPYIVKDGDYYYTCKASGNGIAISRSMRLTVVNATTKKWSLPYEGPSKPWNIADLWAPELFHIGDRWYVYYAAGRRGQDGITGYGTQRSGVLRSKTDDPLGEWEDMGMLYTGYDYQPGIKPTAANTEYAIDLTTFELKGQRYAVWSGNGTDAVQQIRIATMSDPCTISSSMVILSTPTQSWETMDGRKINEGPAILVNEEKGKLFIVYSCNPSWTKNYRLAWLMLDMNDGDPMNPADWQKSSNYAFWRCDNTKEPVSGVNGLGHCTFTKSPDGTEDWIVYHANEVSGSGWRGRSVRAQKFGWDGTTPVFGSPVKTGTEQVMAD